MPIVDNGGSPEAHGPSPAQSVTGHAGEVLRAFLVLGVTSFGGPIAHLAYFRREFVDRRRWLSEEAYAELVAFCQFLPGPTSSQAGFLIGWRRAGLAGALAAWGAFTLPSALLLTLAGVFFVQYSPGDGWLAGVLAAVLAVVTQAVLGMSRSLCPDAPRASLAAGVAIVALLSSAMWTPLAALLLAGVAGALLLRGGKPAQAASEDRLPSLTLAVTCLVLFAACAALAVVAAGLLPAPWGQLYGICFGAGSLVFGGGHVVLPLLHDPLVRDGLVSQSAFMAGYGAAQAVPGPLFTVAAWLGGVAAGLPGALLALVAIFLPGLLLALGCLRFYHGALAAPWARRGVMGLNAGVVGLLGAALWHPIGHEALTGASSLALALAAFIALESWRLPAWVVVPACGLMSLLIA